MSISKLLETQFIDISGSHNKTHNFYWGIISKPSENNSRKPHTTFNEHVLNHIVDSKSHGTVDLEISVAKKMFVQNQIL